MGLKRPGFDLFSHFYTPILSLSHVKCLFLVVLWMKAVVVTLAGVSVACARTPHPWEYNPNAQKWESTPEWAVGSNFVPSSAVNQLEMWQADTVRRLIACSRA